MEYRRLGRSGVMVSEICLGTMTFGREIDESYSHALVDMFLDAGGNFIDTADVYSAGVSEEITGRKIKDKRDDIVLATKVRFPMGDGPNDVGVSRKHIIRGCEASLRRLGTDYIDLYQIHAWDGATPLEETMGALTDLVRQGKVRYLGLSNFSGWQIAQTVHVVDTRGYERFVSLQPQYSMVERNIDYEVRDAALEAGLGMIPWGPLGSGFLTGKYRRDQKPPEDSRIAKAEEWQAEHWHKRAVERNWATLDVVGEISEETGKSYAQIALRWLLQRDGVTAPIVGARKADQLQDNLGAAGWKLDDKQMQRLTEVSEPPEIYPYNFITNAQRV
ncbi:MAG: aldo/keto reductase [Actinobacteria bacterium]|nr:aldo/keto reductase [Actinomycetota bacterium]